DPPPRGGLPSPGQLRRRRAHRAVDGGRAGGATRGGVPAVRRRDRRPARQPRADLVRTGQPGHRPAAPADPGRAGVLHAVASLTFTEPGDAGAYLARLVRLDPGALVRLRPAVDPAVDPAGGGPAGVVALWAPLPFG